MVTFDPRSKVSQRMPHLGFDLDLCSQTNCYCGSFQPKLPQALQRECYWEALVLIVSSGRTHTHLWNELWVCVYVAQTKREESARCKIKLIVSHGHHLALSPNFWPRSDITKLWHFYFRMNHKCREVLSKKINGKFSIQCTFSHHHVIIESTENKDFRAFCLQIQKFFIGLLFGIAVIPATHSMTALRWLEGPLSIRFSSICLMMENSSSQSRTWMSEKGLSDTHTKDHYTQWKNWHVSDRVGE